MGELLTTLRVAAMGFHDGGTFAGACHQFCSPADLRQVSILGGRKLVAHLRPQHTQRRVSFPVASDGSP